VPLRSVNDALKEPSSSKELQVDRGRQRDRSKVGGRPSSSVNTQVYPQRSSFKNRVNGHSKSYKQGEVSVNWPPMLNTSFPYSEVATSFDPAAFEANVSGQVSSNLSVSRVYDEVVSNLGHKDASVVDIQPTWASFNYSNELPATSSLSLPWFFQENKHSPSMVVNSSSSSSLFSG